MAILTISRQIGSGGRQIGYTVADLLRYELLTKENIFSEIRKTDKQWERWATDLDEHCPTIWEKYDWSFRGFGALMQSLILQYSLKDKVIIIGRGGNFLLKDIPYALRIRVVAPMDKRIERLMKRESVDKETARWIAEKTDRERSCFLQALYGKDWNDPEEYDMVFDAGSKTMEEIVATVRESLLARDNQNTGHARKVLEMRALAAKIKAAILTDPKFFVPTLDVFFDGAEIALQGVIHGPQEHKKIEAAAREIAGDVPVRCSLHYRL